MPTDKTARRIPVYRGLGAADYAAFVRSVSNTTNGHAEDLATFAAATLTVSERARFVERLSSIISAVAERMAQTT